MLVVNSSWFASNRDRLCHGLGLGHGWRVMGLGQMNDTSRGSRVVKCDPLSALGRMIRDSAMVTYYNGEPLGNHHR